MKTTTTVFAKPRTRVGSGPARRLRRAGQLPAVIYGSGKPPRNLEVNRHDLEQTLRGHAGEHMLMDLTIEGEAPVKVLLKEIQHHPVTGQILHVDFNEVSMTQKLRVEVPVRLVGDPVGVTQQGGVLEHLIRQIEIECLPGDIPEQVDVDVSGLGIGQSVTVADIRVDASRITVVTSPEVAVATVAAPRVEEEVAPAAAAGEAAPTEPEVIREKKPAEGEAEEEGAEKAEGKKEEGKKAEGKKEEGGKEEGRKGK